MKEFFLGIVSILVATIILAVGGEIVIRVYQLYTGHLTNQRSFTRIALDAELGWRPTENYLRTGELLDAVGESYPVEITTNSAGYRIFGNPLEKTKKKVLFLGDSLTHAMDVSNDKTYFGILKEELNIEVFAIGVEGYGTLQQYLMLDKIIDRINPDIVILQFCGNDFINNSYQLELISSANNNGLRRPYLENGKVKYRTPSSIAAIREFAANYSHFLYFIISRIDRLNAGDTDSSEQLIGESGMSYPLFKESVETTEQILKKIRMRTPPDTLVFSFSNIPPFSHSNVIKRILENSGIPYIEGVAVELRAANKKGITTTAADKMHWNNAGHRVVASVLKRYFDNVL